MIIYMMMDDLINNVGVRYLSSTDGRVVKAEDLSPSAVMRVGSIPTLCTFCHLHPSLYILLIISLINNIL